MTFSRTVLGLVATLAFAGAFVPAFASAQTSYFNYESCGYVSTYPYNYTNYPYQYTNCPHGTLFVYVQVNKDYNPYNHGPQDFTVSVTGERVSKPSFVGSDKGTVVYLNGAYSVTVSPFEGYTPSYSPGCTGGVNNGTQAICIITETPTNYPVYYNQYSQQYQPYSSGPIYQNANAYVTPSYVPTLPNTGFEPRDGAAIAFAMVALMAVAFLSFPYVRKAFGTIFE